MRRIFLAILAFLAPLAFAQNLSQPILEPYQHFTDASGSPCAGCSLYSYLAGTTTPTPTYTSAVISVPTQNTNPIVLDAAGGATIWTALTGYKFVLKDTNGTTLWTVDNVVSVASLGCLGNNTIAKGCTSATTAQGAATAIVDNTNIKPASVTNANVNGVYAVTKYGAVGDCTGSGSTAGCTNNHNAIQSAIDAAYATGGSVYFPTNTGATSQTVYYTATAVNPKGVVIFGPGGIPANYFANSMPVAVRGAPSNDVFAVTDPSDGGYVAPLVSPSFHDLAILVDDSVDASSSLTYRRPGRICKDIVANGTAVITSAAQCTFQPGDVGQAITAGATTTTILSYQSATQVTLNATVTTGTGVSGYISVMGLSVSQNIGNCAIAYPDRAGAASALTVNKGLFYNLHVGTISNNALHFSCGMFFQGNNEPFGSVWRDSSVNAAFPLAYVPENQATPTTAMWTGLGDVNVWDHLWLYGEYPLLAYGGNYGSLRDVQISGFLYGPHIVLAYGVNTYMHDWKIDIPEMETLNSFCGSPYTAFRINGKNHIVTRMGMGLCGANNATFQWDASGSTVNFGAQGIGTFNVTGDLNAFTVPSNGDTLTSVATFGITGRGNTLTTGTSSNPYGSQPGRAQFAGGLSGSANTFGSPLLSHGGEAFNRDNSFIDTGAAAYYFNKQDLWFWPSELIQDAGGALVPVADSTSETGQYVPTVSNTNQYFNGTNGHDWFIGSQIPPGKFRTYFRIKSLASTSNVSLYVEALESAVWTDIGTCTGATALGTSYLTFSCDADATGLTGDQFRLIVKWATQAGAVAWAAIRPNDSDPIPSGWATGSNGNGRWVTDPTGTITERGCISVTNGAGTSTTGTITFPLTFPTAADSLVISLGNNPGGSDDAFTAYYKSLGTTGASVVARCSVNIGGSGCANISNTVPVCWIAIGR